MASSVGATFLSIQAGNLWLFFNAMKQENFNVWETTFNLPDRKLDRPKKTLFISYFEGNGPGATTQWRSMSWSSVASLVKMGGS